MTTFRARPIADRLEKILTRHGLTVSRMGSQLSQSQYLFARNDFDEIKIRISDHEARPSYQAQYGCADIEIGPHGMSVAGGAVDGARVALKRLKIEPDAALRGALTKQARAKEQRQAEAAALAQEVRANDVYAAEHQKFVEWAGDRYAATSSLPYKYRKKARNRLRKQYEAETGKEST